MLNAQTLNPPYPRLGVFTFSGQTEACVEILRDFDIIAIPKNVGVARLLKEQDPDRILLETSGHLLDWTRFSVQWPDEWYYWDENGEKFDASGRDLGMYLMNITKHCLFKELIPKFRK